MRQAIRDSLFWIAGLAAIILLVLLASLITPKTLTRAQYQELGFFRFDTPREISEMSLVDHTGARVTNDSLKGKWSLLFFGFTFCPDICPTTLSVLNDAVQDLENPPQVIMVSVDPQRDTPSILAAYVPRFNPAFRGFTGKLADIRNFATNLNVAFRKVPGLEIGTYSVNHSANIVVVNPHGQYTGFIKAPHTADLIQGILSHLD